MKIKMKSLAAGPAGTFLAGQVYSSPEDLPDALALAFLEGQYAEVVVGETTRPAESQVGLETADLKMASVEQAVKPRAKRKS